MADSLRFQADNDLKFAIVRAVRRREPAIDFVSAHDAELRSISDPELLEHAYKHQRVVVSHDRQTLLNHFHNRLTAGKSSPGLLIASQGASVGAVVESIIVLWGTAEPADLRDCVYHLPSLGLHNFPR